MSAAYKHSHIYSGVEHSWKEIYISNQFKTENEPEYLSSLHHRGLEIIVLKLPLSKKGFYICRPQILEQTLFNHTLEGQTEHRVSQSLRHKPVTFRFS